jgi:hypothetical protein
LVRTETGVGGWQEGGEMVREIVELQRKVTHTVHELPVLWVGLFFEDLL